MKLLHALLLAAGVLLVPFVDCQWYTPMVAQNSRRFQSRFGVDSTPSPVTAGPTRAFPAPPTAGPRMVLAPRNDAKISSIIGDLMMRISRTVTQSSSKTELFSPLSIATVASLLFLGSRGVTQDEFAKVLNPPDTNMHHYQQRYGALLANLLAPNPIDDKLDQWRQKKCPQDEDDDYYEPEQGSSQVIRLANGIFHQDGVQMKQKYVNLARDMYGALVTPFNSQNPAASAAMINRWVSDVTAGKIPRMLDGPLSPSSSVVIVNALYFKGKWKTQFEPLVTRQAPFFPHGYSAPSYDVRMMSLSGCLPFFKTRDGVSIVGLPYRDDTSTMYLIQPTNSSMSAIRRLQATMTAKQLDSWIAQMDLRSTMVRLPKMHLQSSINLLQSFQKLGFSSILSPAKSNLTSMVEERQGQYPYVNQIMHKVDLTIDEEGTEGAAATSALIDRISSQKSFNGNTPFLIYLRHDATRLPLFYGPVFDPR